TEGGAGSFDYSSSGGLSPSSFTLATTGSGSANKDTKSSTDHVTGDYSVRVSLACGWHLAGINCSAGGGQDQSNQAKANISLASVQTVTSTRTSPSLPARRSSDLTEGGAGSFDYSSSGGLSPSSFTLATTGSGSANKDTKS